VTRLFFVLCMLLFAVGESFAAVDANTASAEALQSVRGIGPAIAKRIVDERRRGPFKGLDDLQARVRGVGEATLRRMVAAGLTVGTGGTTAASADKVGKDTTRHR
jgi:competence protein ComEA